MLSFYVHRSKQDEHRTSNGIQLRKHNRGNQGEQRKTTIMLSKFLKLKLIFFILTTNFQLLLLLYLLFVKFLKQSH
jgi:hypothetical protein